MVFIFNEHITAVSIWLRWVLGFFSLWSENQYLFNSQEGICCPNPSLHLISQVDNLPSLVFSSVCDWYKLLTNYDFSWSICKLVFLCGWHMYILWHPVLSKYRTYSLVINLLYIVHYAFWLSLLIYLLISWLTLLVPKNNVFFLYPFKL